MRIHKDWACDRAVKVQFTEVVSLHYSRPSFKRKNTLPMLDHDDNADCHAIGNTNLKAPMVLSTWRQSLEALVFWELPMKKHLKTRDIGLVLRYLPGNAGWKKGDIIHHLLILEVHTIDTELGEVYFYDLLDGEKIIEMYPYHEYCDLHGTILPEGKRKWKL